MRLDPELREIRRQQDAMRRRQRFIRRLAKWCAARQQGPDIDEIDLILSEAETEARRQRRLAKTPQELIGEAIRQADRLKAADAEYAARFPKTRFKE